MKISQEILNKLNEYYEFCKTKHIKHLKIAEKYDTLYKYTTAPVIIISSLTTVLASYNSSIVDPRLAISVAIFSGLTTICQSLISFFEYNVRYEKHLNVSNKFINLSRAIETEMYTNYYFESENDEYIKFLLEKIQKELTNIQDAEPYLPSSMRNKNCKEINDRTNTILIHIDDNMDNMENKNTTECCDI